MPNCSSQKTVVCDMNALFNFLAVFVCHQVRYRSLESFHVFVVAQVLRRPIIVLGSEWVLDVNDQPIQANSMPGMYLPVMSNPVECSQSPLFLAYKTGHFTSVMPLSTCCSVPIVRNNGCHLPVPFLMENEIVDDIVLTFLELSCDNNSVVCLAPVDLPEPIERLVAVFTEHGMEKIIASDAVEEYPGEATETALPDIEQDTGTETGKEFPVAGRRIVDIAFLASQLKNGCSFCNHHLYLHNCLAETKHGLASRLTISCSRCGEETRVDTSRKHRRKDTTRGPGIYDVNSKAALGKTEFHFTCLHVSHQC